VDTPVAQNYYTGLLARHKVNAKSNTAPNHMKWPVHWLALVKAAPFLPSAQNPLEVMMEVS
tara:strand:- start:67 stop:249 length:183 start_codon:yes stop_codon:yes gene_type:complete